MKHRYAFFSSMSFLVLCILSFSFIQPGQARGGFNGSHRMMNGHDHERSSRSFGGNYRGDHHAFENRQPQNRQFERRQDRNDNILSHSRDNSALSDRSHHFMPTFQHGSRRVNSHERMNMDRSHGARTMRSHEGMVHDRTFVRNNHTYIQRTIVRDHHTDIHAYRPYYWGHHRFYSYVPYYRYNPYFIGWVWRPWRPIRYRWWWFDDPLYVDFGYYWHPYPLYYGPSYWITDFVIADILAQEREEERARAQEEYDEHHAHVVIDDRIKDQIKSQVESELRAREKEDSVPIEQTLRSNYIHVVSNDLEVSVNNSQETCSLTSGDIIKTLRTPSPGEEVVQMTVVTSKKGSCLPQTRILISLDDLQDMKNNFSETVDKGLNKLHEEQGKGQIPSAPENAQAKPEELINSDEEVQSIQENP